jgi:hypothetical protein
LASSPDGNTLYAAETYTCRSIEVQHRARQGRRLMQGLVVRATPVWLYGGYKSLLTAPASSFLPAISALPLIGECASASFRLMASY